jgi:diguanylate cyclase (GGDEF)-like protein/PAS domain S-box-containing protein
VTAAARQANVVAQAIRVLQLEDNVVDAELISRQLADGGFNAVCRVVATELEFRRALVDFAPQVVLSDFSLRGFDGLSAMEIARALAPTTPFIFVSGTIGEERAIEALKRGATDYVLKDNLRRLVPAIQNALRQFEVTRAKELAEQMLRQSESRLQGIIDTSRDWIWECDREGRFTFSSPSIEDILGYTRYEVLGRRGAEYIDPIDELQLNASFSELETDDHLEKPITLRWRHKNGKTRWLERTMVGLRDDAGILRGVRGIDRDVTVRMAQEVRIRRLNRALRFVSGTNSAVMRIRDRDRLLKEACRLAVRVGGYMHATILLLPAESAGTQPLVCAYGSGQEDGVKWTISRTLPEGRTLVQQALASGEPAILHDLTEPTDFGVRNDDREALLEVGCRSCIAMPLIIEGTSIGVIELHAGEPGVFGDAELALLKQVGASITFSLQYLHNKESAEYLEYFDPLTGLAQRRLYVQRLGAAIEAAAHEQQRVALAVVDICELGTVNDSLGHHAGDLVLQLVAERLKNVFRDTSLVCRLSGDRFAVLSVDVSTDAAAALRDRVMESFDAPFTIQDHELRLSIRVGMAQCPDDAADAEVLLQQADTALQHAKQAGAQYVRHRPDMSAQASQRLNLINELRRAAAERHFTLSYQPKVAIETGLADGVEALLRWSDQRKDPVPPSVFVPILESLGLINEIGTWVIAHAMAEAAGWFAAADDGFRVAVNVSPVQLNHEDFAERVLQLLGDGATGTKRLELEVTESSLLADPQRASASLSRLRAAGVTIAIDDFGTGHSSLRVLAGLPIDVLKIDRSFVQDLPTNRSHRLIVQTTIGLAKSLGLKTVAEGVETAEQLEILRELGCGTIQGYLIGRPATARDISTWLVDTRPKLPNPPRRQENERPGVDLSEAPQKAPSQHRKHR